MAPPNGARGVDPGLRELRVTFNVAMAASYSWCGGGPSFPKIPDGQRPRWIDGGKIFRFVQQCER